MRFLPRQRVRAGELWVDYGNTVIRFGQFMEHHGQWPMLPEHVFLRIAEWSRTTTGGEQEAIAFCLGWAGGAYVTYESHDGRL